MKLRQRPAKTEERRATILSGLILLQALCALFFVGDVIEDFLGDGQLDDPLLLLESVAAIALIGGVIFLMVELRHLLSRMSDMQTGLNIAHGQLAKVIKGFFDEWNLTAAERDVAIMILKGLDNETIAQVRKTARGTVRAQATNVYAKSKTDSRAQFISLFVEELLAENQHLGDDADQGPSGQTNKQNMRGDTH